MQHVAIQLLEAVLGHTGHQNNKTAMTFEIKWKGETATTMEPSKNVRLVDVLHVSFFFSSFYTKLTVCLKGSVTLDCI